LLVDVAQVYNGVPRSRYGQCGSGTASMKRWFVVILIAVAFSVPAGAEELPKGFKLLVEHGFQIQGLVTKDDVFHLPTYLAANYTTLLWAGESNTAVQGRPPGMPWARWAGDTEHMPPVGGEAPFMGKLISVSLGDEPDLNSPKVRQKQIDWHNRFRD